MAPLLIALCLLVAGCGAGEEAAVPATSLVVTVDRDGSGPGASKEARVTCEARATCPADEVPARAFAPVDRRRACTDIFGGPQTATITGTLEGRPVSARFSRRNGCEIARWDEAAPLLDRVR